MAVFVNDHIGEAIISDGKYDRLNLEMTELVLAELFQMSSLKESVCLDVGANIGNHALHYSTFFKRVIAFEPNPIAYKLLEASVLKNKVPNVQLCTTALGQKSETKTLSLYEGNLGMSTFVPLSNENYVTSDTEMKVEDGDSLLKTLLIGKEKINFIKIDVEGFECDVLNGLRETIIENNPVIAIELDFTGASESERSKAVVAMLTTLNYNEFFTLDAGTTIFRNRYINFLSRMIFGEERTISSLDKFERKHYHQVYCAPAKKTI
jgi:FkbM family methyltransferase